jgi:2-oxoglutarate ferredoxin oxidoreductase subunit alpha
MRTLLMNELNVDPRMLIPVLHYDGTPITARFISQFITRHVHAEIVAPKNAFRESIK